MFFAVSLFGFPFLSTVPFASCGDSSLTIAMISTQTGTDACVTPVLTPTEAASKSTSAIPTLFPDSPAPASGAWTLGKGTHTAEILGELEVGEGERAAILGAVPGVKAVL